jgi:hypothetical protein
MAGFGFAMPPAAPAASRAATVKARAAKRL